MNEPTTPTKEQMDAAEKIWQEAFMHWKRGMNAKREPREIIAQALSDAEARGWKNALAAVPMRTKTERRELITYDHKVKVVNVLANSGDHGWNEAVAVIRAAAKANGIEV